MKTRCRRTCRFFPLVMIAAICAAPRPAVAQTTAALPASALQQIQELQAEKTSRTATQRKISSSLLYAARARRGVPLTASIQSLASAVPIAGDGRVAIEIAGKISKAVVEAIERAGGQVLAGAGTAGAIRATVPLESIETLAAIQEVRAIYPAMAAATQRTLAGTAATLSPQVLTALDRAQPTASALQESPALSPLANLGAVTSEGSKAHGADRARRFFGVNGAGIKIGVLSDSDDFKEQSIASGDLPLNTVTIPGESGRPGSGEGTAMMEIVHDVAPGAQLFFATAFKSPTGFADNIRRLRFEFHCDIIVDDVIYYFESPYQDDVIAQAVNEVIADGAQYFSSAGNQGNADDGTSGVWEGDFKAAATALPTLPSGYVVHDFGHGVISNRISTGSGPLYLHWSDPGSLDDPQSSNDYDLFLLDANLRNVVLASTDVQDGAGLPFEYLGYSIPANFQIVVAKTTGSADRALHLVLSRGRIAIATAGATYGHSTAVGAFGVAAVNVASAGGGEFSGGATTQVELFSGDGNRRIFYDPLGHPITPGNVLIGTGGGEVRRKPDVTAADGVTTTLPPASGLNPFFGTSAAAPHAAAIAGLLESAKPAIGSKRLRSGLTKTAIDIETAGRDRDSGFGIVSAYDALDFIKATPTPFLELGPVTVTPTTGSFLLPGGSATISAALVNNGGALTDNLSGTLYTTMPGVAVTQPWSAFPALAPGESHANTTPYAFTLSPTAACGVPAVFTLEADYSGAGSPRTFPIKVQTGRPNATPVSTAYAGPVVPIPELGPGVNIPIAVSGVGAMSNVGFRIGGSSCSADIGSTTVGLDHTWVGDLVLKLTSPSGTTVTLMDQPGGPLNSGNNFCQTVLSDGATNPIQLVTSAQAPYTGSFKPASPLSAFAGENGNGTWVLNISDKVAVDSGSMRAFALDINGFTCSASLMTALRPRSGSER